MLGHHHTAGNVAAVPDPDSFKRSLEALFRRQTIEQRHPVIATKRDEMQAALVLIADRLTCIHADCSRRRDPTLGDGRPILSESRLPRLPHPSRAFCGRVGPGHDHDTHLFKPASVPVR